MTTDSIIMWYMIIGVLYAFVNGAIRKIDTDGDWQIPLMWLLLWPLGTSVLIISCITSYYRRFYKFLKDKVVQLKK